MMSRVSMYLVSLSCCGVWGCLDASEPVAEQNSGLNLFMSAEEQLALERDQADASLKETELISDEHTMPDTAAISDISDTATVSAHDRAARDESQNDCRKDGRNNYMARYDGLVSKGDKILSVWFNGDRVSGSDVFTNINITVVNPVGELLLESGDRAERLFPGDYFPVHESTTQGVTEQ